MFEWVVTFHCSNGNRGEVVCLVVEEDPEGLERNQEWVSCVSNGLHDSQQFLPTF